MGFNLTEITNKELVVRVVQDGQASYLDKFTEWGIRFVKGQASSDGERVKRIDGLMTLGEATGIVHNIGHDQINVHNSFDSIYAFRYERVIEDGNHFNKYPLVYIKQENLIEDGVEYEYYWLCATQLQGYYAPHVFRKNDGSLRDYILVGVYEAFRDADGKLRSIPNVLPTVSRSATNFLTDARLNDGLGVDSEYTITDIMEQHYLNHRWLIRLGTKNSQSKLAGFTTGRRNGTDLILEDGTSVNHVVVSNAIGEEYRIGQTIKVGDGQDGTQALVGRLITNILVDNPTSGQTSIYFDGEPVNVVSGQIIGNRAYITGATDGIVASDGYLLENNGKYPCVIEGIENPFGNVWKNIAGIKLLGDDIYVTNDLRDYNWSANVDNFVKLSYKVPQANGYAKEMGFDPKHPYAQITKAVGGGSTTYYADYFYQNYVVDEYRTVFVGGTWSYGSSAGLWFWNVGDGLGTVGIDIGSRLSKRPN